MDSEILFDITKTKDSDIDISFKDSNNGTVLWIIGAGDNVIQIRCNPSVLNECFSAIGRYWAGE